MEKDIFDIFREQQHGLDEMPSGQVWQKLEKKLDKVPKKRRGIIRFFPMSVAAAVFLVVFMGSLAAIIVVRLSRHDVEMAITEHPDGQPIPDSLTNFTDPATETIAEISTTNTDQTNITTNRSESAAADISAPEKNLTIEDLADIPMEMDDATAGSAAPAAPAPATEDVFVVTAEKATDLSEKDVYEAPAEKADRAVITEAKAKSAPGKPSIASAATKKEAAGAKENALVTPEVVLSQLEGKWQGVQNGQTNFEEWKQIDANNWVGKGVTVVNGDTTFTETMQIARIGNTTYFTGNFDPFGGTVVIPITYYDNHSLVFENKDIQGFPNQVTIEVKEGQLTTTIQNNTATPPSLSQNQYLANRNVVKQNKATRKLKKIIK